MKARVLVATLLSLALLCGCALLQGPDATGRWEGTATFELSPVGPQPRQIVLILNDMEGAVTGTLTWFEAYDTSLVTDVAGIRTRSNIEISGTVHGLLMTLEGKLHRRAMVGTCTFRGATSAWAVTRVG